MINWNKNEPNENTILDYLIDNLQNGIDEAKTIVAEQVENAPLKASIISNVQIISDVDASFSLTEKIPNTNNEKSTPVIICEVESRKTEKTANTGRRLFGDSVISFVVMVAREGRKRSAYKSEVVTVTNFIEETFANINNVRIVIDDVAFNDFSYMDVPVSGSSIFISTPLGNYDYSIN